MLVRPYRARHGFFPEQCQCVFVRGTATVDFCTYPLGFRGAVSFGLWFGVLGYKFILVFPSFYLSRVALVRGSYEAMLLLGCFVVSVSVTFLSAISGFGPNKF